KNARKEKGNEVEFMDRENGIKEDFRYAGVPKRDMLRQRVLKLAIVKWSSPQSTAFKMEFIPIDSDYP
ncbi:hypothetical protein NPIL_636751, partial [Nephila pilipes]